MDFKADRERTGLTQAEYAKRLGVSDRALRYWESGEKSPSDIAMAELTRRAKKIRSARRITVA